MDNLKKVLTDAIVEAGADERIDHGEMGIMLSVLGRMFDRVINEDTATAMDRAITRDRLGIAVDTPDVDPEMARTLAGN